MIFVIKEVFNSSELAALRDECDNLRKIHGSATLVDRGSSVDIFENVAILEHYAEPIPAEGNWIPQDTWVVKKLSEN
jgi:hypothetical protein